MNEAMSRRTRERWLEAAERWPNLQRLLQSCFDEEALKRHGSADAAMDRAIGDWPLKALQDATREWWDFNATRSWKSGGLDIVSEGFGVGRDFPKPTDARRYMNQVYDKLIVAIRAQAGKDWRPDAAPVQADG